MSNAVTVNLGVVTVVPTGNVSKGNRRIAKAEIIDAQGNRHFVTTYLAAESGANAIAQPAPQAVAPTKRKAKTFNTAEVQAENPLAKLLADKFGPELGALLAAKLG